MKEINRQNYLAWKENWLSMGRTLDDAVEYGRLQGGESYAADLKRFIEEQEKQLSQKP